jgi:hypothetical protein
MHFRLLYFDIFHRDGFRFSLGMGGGGVDHVREMTVLKKDILLSSLFKEKAEIMAPKHVQIEETRRKLDVSPFCAEIPLMNSLSRMHHSQKSVVKLLTKLML